MSGFMRKKTKYNHKICACKCVSALKICKFIIFSRIHKCRIQFNTFFFLMHQNTLSQRDKYFTEKYNFKFITATTSSRIKKKRLRPKFRRRSNK